MRDKFYVYLLKDPRNCVPFYVGKGTGLRAFRHEKEVRKHNRHTNQLVLRMIKSIIEDGHCVDVEIVEENLTHLDAAKLEIDLISTFGRINKKTGSLCNYTDGGEGSYGRIYKHSEETKRKISEAGKLRQETAESNLKRSNAMLGKYKGRIMSDAWCAKISESMKGHQHSEDTKKSLSLSRMGANNPSAKRYEVQTPDGIQIIVSMKCFCKTHNLNYSKMLAGRVCNGFHLIRRIEEENEECTDIKS